MQFRLVFFIANVTVIDTSRRRSRYRHRFRHCNCHRYCYRNRDYIIVIQSSLLNDRSLRLDILI